MAKNDKIIMTVEKTKTGFSAFCENYPIFTTGVSVPELMNNASNSRYFDVANAMVGKHFFGYFSTRHLIV